MISSSASTPPTTLARTPVPLTVSPFHATSVRGPRRRRPATRRRPDRPSAHAPLDTRPPLWRPTDASLYRVRARVSGSDGTLTRCGGAFTKSVRGHVAHGVRHGQENIKIPGHGV